jgi:hypothetical protein
MCNVGTGFFEGNDVVVVVVDVGTVVVDTTVVEVT